jgi:hypothetical protein
MKSHSYSPPLVLLVTVLSLANCDFAVGSEKIVDRVPLPSAEGGHITSLEIVIFKPDGKGPFPAILGSDLANQHVRFWLTTAEFSLSVDTHTRFRCLDILANASFPLFRHNRRGHSLI